MEKININLKFFMPLCFLLIVVNCGLNELCSQVDYFEKRLLIDCVKYDDYGCWCGPGGSGRPVDRADACCRDHDRCYDKIIANQTCDPYLAQYHFKHGKCLDPVGTCLNDLCKCDQAIAVCLSRQPYHWYYYGWTTLNKC